MSDTVPELDDIASRALASIILERTADTMHDNSELAAVALTSLAAETGLVLDVAAAILTATSWLAGTAGLSAEVIFAASVAFAPDETAEGVATPDNPDWAGMTPAQIVEREFGPGVIDVTGIDTTDDLASHDPTTAVASTLDRCPVCERQITDDDPQGLVLTSGQRWCRDHAATCGITIDGA